MIQKTLALSKEFIIPVAVLIGIITYLPLDFLGFHTPAFIIILASIILGSFNLFTDTLSSLMKKEFALDYIAILAIVVALITGEYLVAAILALMIASGNNLESYAVSRAKQSLTKLTERIPNQVVLWANNHPGEKENIEKITIGQQIFIKKGEVIPLDGVLVSESGSVDESSLTGEAEFIDKTEGDTVHSGTINMGKPIVIKVTKEEKDSSYNKILNLVRQAQQEKSPLVRLADRYSAVFTVTTLTITAIAYFLSGQDLIRVLAVLAIATPCPLIIATPIALLGGVNAAAKQRIIVKRLAGLESLARINALVFDKTGTITLGKPKIQQVEILDKQLHMKKVLSIAAAIERNSLHPLAKTIVDYSKNQKAEVSHAQNVEEVIGLGISGEINHIRYNLSKLEGTEGMAIELTRGGKKLAIFRFEDEIKNESKEVIRRFKEMGLKLYIFTGDKKESAQKLLHQLGEPIEISAQMTPEDKQSGIRKLKNEGEVIAMVGDGINDAPALALADVGLVFSNEEQTASSEAADLVFLGGHFSSVLDSYKISKRTINIALQSIIAGIGLSMVGMIFASAGLISPIWGAGLQEAIDVAVILNAIRASHT